MKGKTLNHLHVSYGLNHPLHILPHMQYNYCTVLYRTVVHSFHSFIRFIVGAESICSLHFVLLPIFSHKRVQTTTTKRTVRRSSYGSFLMYILELDGDSLALVCILLWGKYYTIHAPPYPYMYSLNRLSFAYRFDQRNNRKWRCDGEKK